jgi:hypothetical protein
VVTGEQVIVGAMLFQHPVDRSSLHPLLDTFRQQLAEAGIRPRLRTVLADARYASEENCSRAAEQKLRLLVPLAKHLDKHRTTTPAWRRDLARLPATARAVRRMRHHRGRAGYKLRAQTVEPVFGQIKTCQKLTMMSRRGLDACCSEWLLAAAAHNLRKLHTPPPQRIAPGRPLPGATATHRSRKRPQPYRKPTTWLPQWLPR